MGAFMAGTEKANGYAIGQPGIGGAGGKARRAGLSPANGRNYPPTDRRGLLRYVRDDRWACDLLASRKKVCYSLVLWRISSAG